MKLIFATNNQHKALELSDLLDKNWDVKSLVDIGCVEEIPETGDTLESNALQKARFVYNKFGYDCFADDTGLEIDVLGGAPGVFSARYAGSEKSSHKNILKVLDEMRHSSNRAGRFRTVIALIIKGEVHLFEGLVEGAILEAPTGEGGFGYDPIFMPLDANDSFANMPLTEKNKISHRGRAVRKLVDFLNSVQP
jgi:XTP/dITP diphosphohydrolase